MSRVRMLGILVAVGMGVAGLPAMAQDYAIEDEPSPQDVRALEDGLYRYNVQQTARGDGRWLAIFVRDDNGAVMA